MKTTIDPIFGLEWSKTNKLMTFDEAVKYAKSLGDGWRLPTAFELSSMFDLVSGRAIINEFIGAHYWSSTAYAPNTNYAWGVYFSNGYDGAYNKTNTNYVRCVRGNQKFDNLSQYKEYLLMQKDGE